MTNEIVRRDDTAPVHTERDAHLSDRTRQRITDGVAVNTRKAYTRQWALFTAWCQQTGRVPLPTTPETLAEYVTELADADRSPATIEQAMAAVRTNHRAAGHAGHPDTTAALLVLRDHRRRRADAGQRAKEATPITVAELRAMVDTCSPPPLDPDATLAARAKAKVEALRGIRDHVVLVLGIAMYGRRSELIALRLDDLTETHDGLVVLKRVSKTDQDAKGREVAIPYGQHAATCPVRVVRAWRAALAERGITTGRLLRSVDRHGRIGKSLSGVAVDAIVKERALAAGLPDAAGYSAHSLRAGGATLSAAAGHPISAIADHGGWSRTSPVVFGYVRKVSRWKDNPLTDTGL